MLETQHIVQLLYRKNLAVTIIDYDFCSEEADLLGWHDYLMNSIDALGHAVGLGTIKCFLAMLAACLCPSASQSLWSRLKDLSN